MEREKYLLCVSPEGNHNKFYKMTYNGGSYFTVEYGRVGSTPAQRVYNICQWDKIVQSKLDKGYVDRSNLLAPAGGAFRYSDIASIQGMMSKMAEWADKVIQKNYVSSPISIPSATLDRAQGILNNLTGEKDVDTFNTGLKQLFALIPRRMPCVKDFMADDPKEFGKIIDREQSLLDIVSARGTSFSPSGKSPLDEAGIVIRECSDSERDMVRSHMDSYTQQYFKNAWHVNVPKTRAKFEKYCQDNAIPKHTIHLYYHGSRNPNYYNILMEGLKLRPTQHVVRSGAMFGNGLYFAPKARKSMGYTSLSGSYWANGNDSTTLLYVFKVAMGKQKNVYAYNPTVAGWDEDACRRAGYNSVFAHASANPSLHSGRLYNDEAVVFSEDACTLSYIIELTTD